MYSVAWLPKDRIDALFNIQSRMLNQLSAMESDYVIDNKRKELCEKAHHPEDEKIRGCTHHQSCCFCSLALEQSMSWFASLLTRQKEPSQGSGSQGLFIELSGLHGRRRGMCQRENASLIKACSEM